MNLKAKVGFQRWRVKPIVENISSLEWEYVERCNVCDSRKRTIISRHDRYGFPVRLAICNYCGLGYLVDRLSRSAYSRFYDRWYRRLLSAWFDQRIDNTFLEGYAKDYARRLVDLLDKELQLTAGFTVLDIGGSTGAVSTELMKRYRAKPTVLDPSEEELSVAKASGMETILGQLEDVNIGDCQFDLILVCRTLDHLFDLKTSLERIRKLVKPEGFVFIDYMDLLEHAQHEGSVTTAARLDHCYYFYNEMAPYLYSRFGLGIVSTYFSISMGTVGYLLQPADAKVQSIPAQVLNTVIRQSLHLEREWTSTPSIRTLGDRVRYRLGRILKGGPLRGPG